MLKRLGLEGPEGGVDVVATTTVPAELVPSPQSIVVVKSPGTAVESESRNEPIVTSEGGWTPGVKLTEALIGVRVASKLRGSSRSTMLTAEGRDAALRDPVVPRLRFVDRHKKSMARMTPSAQSGTPD